ncbi:MAG TPA: hypothetical protein DCP92_16940 [Nitrospiraceae bacterium]|jgi:hypothetical protein|nr:hypothetical protein [Nitrospiraceae bacterium]
MPDKKIQVVAYSGYRGEEIPRAFIFSGENIAVVEILKAWTEETSKDRKKRRRFRLKGSDGYIHEIYHDEEISAWFYGS